jgi:hypothetical protein
VVTGSFLNTAGFFTDANGDLPPAPTTASATGTISAQAATSLSPLVVPSTANVGDTITVSTVLSRTDAQPVGAQPVTFSFVGTSGTQMITGTTDPNTGAVTIQITPTIQGLDTVSASFAGTVDLSAASTGTSAVTVYQKTAVALSPFSGSAGAPLNLVATLTTVPGTQPLAGQLVTFNFGSAFPTQTAMTNAAGQAFVTVTPNAGPLAVTASFHSPQAFFVDSSASASATISKAASKLLLANVSGVYGSTQTLLATLTGVGGAPLAARSVSFTVNGKVVGSALTNASGVASLPYLLKGLNPGQYAISAAYAGDANYLAATSSASLAVFDAPITAAHPSLVAQGRKATILATFSQARDLAIAGDFTVTINWGDGSAPQQVPVVADPSVAGQFDIAGLHMYPAGKKVYTVTITISTASKFGVYGSTTTLTSTLSVPGNS